MKKVRIFFKNKSLFFMLLLIIIGVVASTIAYFHKTISVRNEVGNNYLTVSAFGNQMETFGTNKEIGIAYNGPSTNPILLRIKYSERWQQGFLYRNCDGSYNQIYDNDYPASYLSGSTLYSYNENEGQGSGSLSPISITNPLYSFVVGMPYDTTVSISNTINGEEVVDKIWYDNSETDFVLGTDGWYYYKKTIAPGEKVYIFDGYTLNMNLIEDTEYYDYYTIYYHYLFLLDYEAVELNTSSAQSAWGVSYTIDGDDITWSFES